MNEHIILQLLKELDIKDEHDVSRRLSMLVQSDFENLSDKIHNWYESYQMELNGKKIGGETVYDFWIPSAPEKGIYKITANLLFANTVILSDPLYDQFYMMADKYYDGVGDFFGEQEHKYYCPSCKEQWNTINEGVLRNRIKNVLTFYLQAKPLIETNKIIPFVDITPKPRHIYDAPLGKIFSSHDDDVQRFQLEIENAKAIISQLSSKTGHAVNTSSIPYIKESFDLAIEKALMLAGINELFYSEYTNSPSIDFLGQVSGYTFKALYKFMKKSLPDKAKQKFIVPGSVQHFSLPTLAGIPIQEIPEVLLKEQDSLLQFKVALNTKISSISEPFGTPLWEKQLDSVRTSMKRDLIDIEKNLLHLKNDHLRRQTSNVTFMFFSLSLASLALLHQSIDPISAVQSVAGGAGLVGSMKGIMESWLDYRKDVEEQKRRDVYFLWELENQK